MQLVRRHRVFLHDERVGSGLTLEMRHCAHERGHDLVARLWKYLPRDLQGVKQTFRDLPHQFVLWFIVHPWRAAMRADNQQRNTENVRERSQGTHGIAQSRVLHHRDAVVPPNVGASSGSHRVSFVRCRDISQIRIVNHVIDEWGEKRARDARIPGKAARPRGLDELFGVDHLGIP